MKKGKNKIRKMAKKSGGYANMDMNGKQRLMTGQRAKQGALSVIGADRHLFLSRLFIIISKNYIPIL